MIHMVASLLERRSRRLAQASGKAVAMEAAAAAPILAPATPIPVLTLEGIWEYLKVARPDHWFKNVFVCVGSLAAIGYFGTGLSTGLAFEIFIALAVACGISSVNYIVNEILDAPFDMKHPVKRHRPIPSGQVKVWLLLVMAAVLFAGCAVAAVTFFAPPLRFSLLALFVAGMLYNLHPVRAKDVPFVDVIAESINNPIRLFIGWFAVHKGTVCPPLTLTFLFWVFGAYLMTAKRLAEFRFLGQDSANKYRKTFKHYSVRSLLAAMLSYGGLTLVFYSCFALQYKPTLMVCAPLLAVFVLWFLKLTFDPDSFVKEPEKLFTQSPKFLCYSLAMFAVFLVMPFV